MTPGYRRQTSASDALRGERPSDRVDDRRRDGKLDLHELGGVVPQGSALLEPFIAAYRGESPRGEESPMGNAANRRPKHPPPWFVHTAWRVHRGLYRLSGGRFLWITSNMRLPVRAASHCHRVESGQERSVIIGYLEEPREWPP
jgi:hypothetical protein